MISNRARSAITATVLFTAASGLLSGCGSDEPEPEERVYCTDEDGQVVDDDLCDDGRGGHSAGYFFWVGNFGGNTYRVGDRIPSQYRAGSGGTLRVDPRSATARSSAGIPSTGKVTGGTRISGGIGAGTGRGSGAGS